VAATTFSRVKLVLGRVVDLSLYLLPVEETVDTQPASYSVGIITRSM